MASDIPALKTAPKSIHPTDLQNPPASSVSTPPPAMSALKSAAADFAVTFLWVLCSSFIGLSTFLLATTFSLHHLSHLITATLFALHVFTFDIVAAAFGGASFNPTGNAAFYAAGLPGDSLLSMAVRFPAQAAGAVAGAIAAAAVAPGKYGHLVGGPALAVGVHEGAAAEVVLTFGITVVVLWVSLRGPRSAVARALMIAGAVVVLIGVGGGYTGPSMNPANAYGWAYVNNQHNTWEHFYVFWVCPLIGAILAAWVFRILFPPPTPKAKKA